MGAGVWPLFVASFSKFAFETFLSLRLLLSFGYFYPPDYLSVRQASLNLLVREDFE